MPLPPPMSTMRRGPFAGGGVNEPDGPSTSMGSPSCACPTRWRETRPSATRLTVTATRLPSSALLDAEYARLWISPPMDT